MPESEEKTQQSSIEIPDIRTLTLLYTNDIQGEAEQMAYMSTMVKKIRQESEFSLLADAGNWAKGTKLSDHFKGMPMVDIMNVMRYEAVNIGEGEIAFGGKNLYLLADKASFPMVSCNLVEEKTGIAPHFLKKFVTFEKGPFKIAVTGIAAPGNYSYANLAAQDPFVLLPGVLGEIKEFEPDVVILLSRMGMDRDRALARLFPELTVIIGGPDRKHTEKPVREGHSYICQAGERAKFLGSLAIDMQSTLRISRTEQ